MKLTIGNATVSVEGTSTEDIFNALLYEHREFLNGKWVKTSRSMFNRRTKQFLTGLLPRVISHLSSISTPFVLSDARTKSPAPTWPVELETIQLRDYQQEAAQSFLKARRGIIKAGTGAGKCLGKGTPVMMFDGTIKPVEDIKVGEFIMGDDSTPRRVLSLARGTEEMFEIIPTKGSPYTVNRSHVLSFVMTNLGDRDSLDVNGARVKPGQKIDLSVDEYLALTDKSRHCLKGYRVQVEFPQQPIPIDPYLLGLWLGDGSSYNLSITSMDSEIVDWLYSHAKHVGLTVTKVSNKEGNKSKNYNLVNRIWSPNPLKSKFINLNLMFKSHYSKFDEQNDGRGKHIPESYKCNSRETRLLLLAGLIDTDGHYAKDKCYYEITQKNKKLADDIAFVVRTLGFGCGFSEKIIDGCTYFRITICGDIEQIPVKVDRKKARKRKQKKDPLRFGVRLKSIGEGEYFGFEIDGNRRFLLGDCTVTHNTIIAAAIIKAAAVPTLFLVHRTHLLHQTAEKFIQAMPEIEPHLGIIGDGSRDIKPITLATIQTVASMLKRYGKHLQQELAVFRMMIIDEAHRATAEQFVTVAKNLVNCDYRLGLTATPFMSGKERDNLILHGLFGNIVYEVSASELIRQGVLARPFFKFYQVAEPRLTDLKNYRDVYEQGIIHNQHRNKLVADKTLELVRMGRKTLVICSEIKHINILHSMLCERGLSVGVATGSADSRERKKTLDSLASGGYDCIICSTIFDEGVDLPDIGGVVLAAGNKSAPALLQRTGRAIRLKETDNFAVIVDFYDTTHRMLEKHARTRMEIIQQEPEFKIL